PGEQRRTQRRSEAKCEFSTVLPIPLHALSSPGSLLTAARRAKSDSGKTLAHPAPVNAESRCRMLVALRRPDARLRRNIRKTLVGNSCGDSLYPRPSFTGSAAFAPGSHPLLLAPPHRSW